MYMHKKIAKKRFNALNIISYELTFDESKNLNIILLKKSLVAIPKIIKKFFNFWNGVVFLLKGIDLFLLICHLSIKIGKLAVFLQKTLSKS